MRTNFEKNWDKYQKMKELAKEIDTVEEILEDLKHVKEFHLVGDNYMKQGGKWRGSVELGIVLPAKKGDPSYKEPEGLEKVAYEFYLKYVQHHENVLKELKTDFENL